VPECSLSLVGAIVGEFVASQRGLGYVILSAQGTFDTTRVFAAVFMLALLGIVLYACLAWRSGVRHPGGSLREWHGQVFTDSASARIWQASSRSIFI
jgi:ABC-type proline/glycine betaine transport system permease subunit